MGNCGHPVAVAAGAGRTGQAGNFPGRAAAPAGSFLKFYKANIVESPPEKFPTGFVFYAKFGGDGECEVRVRCADPWLSDGIV